MAYSEVLADMTREIISLTHQDVEEKKMFGGLCFMVNGKMCLGVIKERLMVRFDPLQEATLMELDGCSPMDFSGRPMQGFAWVEMDALKTQEQLRFWVNIALEYNKIALPSKKRKR